jgi:transcriptional regulator
MYLPPFREDDDDVLAGLIETYSFATLVSTGPDGATATHLPVVLDRSRGPRGTLRAHMARANEQWKGFDGTEQALVIFQGPHTYISPSWYETRLSVPTWNYMAVHAHGRPSLLNDPEAVIGLLRDTIAKYESNLPAPWSLEKLPQQFVAQMANQIVAFEMPIEKLEGKFKLSQNRPVADRLGAINALREHGEGDSLAIAEAMEASLNERFQH